MATADLLAEDGAQFIFLMKSMATSGEDHRKSSEKWVMEAGTGIEPVFTDLQSNPFPPENKPVGAKQYQDKCGTAGEPDTLAGKPKSSLSQHIADPHKRASRMLGYALTLGDYASWASASAVWAVRLTTEERATLAWAAMKALEAEDAEAVAQTVLGSAGMPLAPFMDPLDDAAFWADVASPAELRAYAVASFVRMTRREKLDFIDFAKGEAA